VLRFLRLFGFLLRIAERRGYERGLAAPRPAATPAPGLYALGRLPDGTYVGSTSPAVLHAFWPDAELL